MTNTPIPTNDLTDQAVYLFHYDAKRSYLARCIKDFRDGKLKVRWAHIPGPDQVITLGGRYGYHIDEKGMYYQREWL